MNTREKEELIRRYSERLKLYGHDPRTLGWLNGRQPIRFGVLTEIGDMEGHSILDVGCGFGDLYSFLLEKGCTVNYTGIDINPDLIKVAREIHPNLRFEVMDFETSDIKEKFDWVISSGVFNFEMSDNEAFITNMLKKMFDLCEYGVSVDFITDYVDYKNKNVYYSNPETRFKYCKSLSKRVTLRHDYMPYEFCVYVYKDDEKDKHNVFSGHLKK